MTLFHVLVLFHTDWPQFQTIVTSTVVVRLEKYNYIPIIFYYYIFIFIEVDLKHK